MAENFSVQCLCLQIGTRDFIVQESQARAPLETGGILIGNAHEVRLNVTRAIGPGPEAQHRPGGFKRDGDYSQKELQKIFTLTEGQEDYVGEWHSHPSFCDASGLDRKSIEWIARNSAYNVENPILIISYPKSEGVWDLLGYAWNENRLHRCPIEVKV